MEKKEKEKKRKKKKEKECRRRSFLCKVRIERRIRTSPSAVPPSVPPCTDSLVRRKSARRFSPGDIGSLAALRPPSRSSRRCSLPNSRVKGGRYRGFRAKFSKSCIKQRIERALGADGGRPDRENGGRNEERRGSSGRLRGRKRSDARADPFGSIQREEKKRGEPPPSPPPCLWDTMMRLFRPPTLRK